MADKDNIQTNNVLQQAKCSTHVSPCAIAAILFCSVAIGGCTEQKEHTAPAIRERDSVSTMTSYGVNSLISDSGVMKYRIVAERWEVNDKRNPPRQIFPRGIFFEQFDEKFHVEAYVQADTAFYFNIQKLWHLIGNVRVRTVDGLRFSSEELYWDQERHEMYSYKYSTVVTPERTLEGNYFSSDERMQHYIVTQTKGSFRKEDTQKETLPPGKTLGDTVAVDSTPKRQPYTPARKR